MAPERVKLAQRRLLGSQQAARFLVQLRPRQLREVRGIRIHSWAPQKWSTGLPRPRWRRPGVGEGRAAQRPPARQLPRMPLPRHAWTGTLSATSRQTTWTASAWPRARATGTAASRPREDSARSRLTTSTPWPHCRSPAPACAPSRPPCGGPASDEGSAPQLL